MIRRISSTLWPPSRKRPLLLLLVLTAVAAALAQRSIQELTKTRNGGPAGFDVPRLSLETRDGRFYRNGATVPFTGWVTDRYQSGEVKLRSAFELGRLHGESFGWFTNGAPELREQFVRGLPDGTRVTWYANGQKRSEGSLIAGRQQGLYRQWLEDGTLAVEAQFEGGKPHGLSRAWHPDGSLKAEALMNYGEVLSRHVYPEGASAPSLPAGTPIP